MEKKDIGIIGYWFASNYGGVVSYYSLYKIIESMGYNPILIENPYLATDREGLDVFSRNFIKNRGCRIAECADINHLEQLNDLANTFLLGSDQVLTTNSIKSFGKLFLMEFANNDKKRIAFSASCGGDTLDSNKQLIEYAKKELQNFTAVSVRETDAIELLEKKFNISTEQTLDPIFFTSKQQYDEIADSIEIKHDEEYMLSYILDPTPDKISCIETIAKETSLSKKVALDGRKFTYATNKKLLNMPNAVLPELDLVSWLNYFSNASYIFTDSFHGAAMAIILNKPFIMYANFKRGYPRFQTLAKVFSLKSRLITSSLDVTAEKIKDDINYKAINKMIKQQVKNSLDWLKKALITNKKQILVKNNESKNLSVTDGLHQNPDFIKIRLLGTLLRDYGVKHIVLSPGGRDVPIIRMFENNQSSFILHSVTDERSAAYFGLGLATQLQQPVVCVCTSGTAASNFLPAVTEAFYTGVPLIVVTADRYGIYLNHGEDQTIPQKKIYDGVIKMEVSVPEGADWKAEYQTRRDISTCILETTHNGFGPVHINMPIDNISIGARASKEDWKLLPFIYPHILRVGFNNGQNEMFKWVDSLKKSRRILLVYGQHAPVSEQVRHDIIRFAEKYNCVITTDAIANFDCRYCVPTYNMLNAISQDEFNRELAPDILITVGGKRLMNDPLTYKIRGGPGNIRHWDVTQDGKVKDFYFRQSSVIESSLEYFFKWFADNAGNIINDGVYYDKWSSISKKYKTPAINGFNAQFIQSKFLPSIPAESMLHLGVGQSFYDCRRWTIDKSVETYCNMGTNGIDGCTSTFMGQCAVISDKLCFLLVGDLSFFYDMNSIWNKTLNKNMRILLVNNNGTGLLRGHNLKAVTSVHNTAAEGWVKSVGFEYISARTKTEYENLLSYFCSKEPQKAVFFEVFCE